MGINKYIKIGSRIKKLRKEKGISQKEMAESLGLAHSTYSNYENDLREPNNEILEKIMKSLEVNLFELIDLKSMGEQAQDALDAAGESVKNIDLSGIANPALETLKYLKNLSNDEKLLYYFNKLNESGRDKAIESVELLTKVPEYKK